MEKWIKLGEKLRMFVNPETFPVAVKFSRADSEDIPPSAKRPLRDLKVTMAPCQGAAMCRRYGWTVAFGKEDLGCAIAAHTYGWERANEKNASEFMIFMNYAGDENAAKQVLKGFLKLDADERLVVIYSPLERTKVEPDVVLVYVNPAQLMRLIHGATQAGGIPLQSSFSGRAASCTEGVIGAFKDNACKVVVPGNGDRVWAGCQDHEMVMAIPAEKLSEVVAGLEKTHQKGIRYPIPTYLKYSPEVALTLPLADIFRPGAVEAFSK
ncbi:MAG: DUF169 domain-containing protein [Deltaproteobacteria bacterium]|nr:DUF169 domain-containing protein [Deltaproteobacteria bacterium]MBW1818643.1 DUF169 domain-containing protein [Deltaproteobacteria bacterium]